MIAAPARLRSSCHSLLAAPTLSSHQEAPPTHSLTRSGLLGTGGRGLGYTCVCLDECVCVCGCGGQGGARKADNLRLSVGGQSADCLGRLILPTGLPKGCLRALHRVWRVTCCGQLAADCAWLLLSSSFWHFFHSKFEPPKQQRQMQRGTNSAFRELRSSLVGQRQSPDSRLQIINRPPNWPPSFALQLYSNFNPISATTNTQGLLAKRNAVRPSF